MKKRAASFLTLFLSSLVAAGPVEGFEQLVEGLRDVIIVLIEFVSDVILDIDSFDEFLFAKILIFAIILLISYTAIKKNMKFMGNNKAVHWIISSAVSILAVRYLSDEFVGAILLQYGALAVGIGVFLPWAIFFFFLHQSEIGPFGRRIGWVVYATAFYAMWWMKGESLGEASWIYTVATIFILISLIFDKSIHKYFQLSDFKKIRTKHRDKVKRSMMRDLRTLDDDLERGIITKETYDRETKEIAEAISKL